MQFFQKLQRNIYLINIEEAPFFGVGFAEPVPKKVIDIVGAILLQHKQINSQISQTRGRKSCKYHNTRGKADINIRP